MIHEPLTLTPKELQEELRLSKQSIIRLLQSGELPSFTVGRRARRVLRSDFEDYIARRTAASEQ